MSSTLTTSKNSPYTILLALLLWLFASSATAQILTPDMECELSFPTSGGQGEESLEEDGLSDDECGLNNSSLQPSADNTWFLLDPSPFPMAESYVLWVDTENTSLVPGSSVTVFQMVSKDAKGKTSPVLELSLEATHRGFRVLAQVWDDIAQQRVVIERRLTVGGHYLTVELGRASQKGHADGWLTVLVDDQIAATVDDLSLFENLPSEVRLGLVDFDPDLAFGSLGFQLMGLSRQFVGR